MGALFQRRGGCQKGEGVPTGGRFFSGGGGGGGGGEAPTGNVTPMQGISVN